jgi:hypothetical protein
VHDILSHQIDSLNHTRQGVKRAADEPTVKKPKKKGRAGKSKAKSKDDMDEEPDADMDADGAASDGEVSRQPTQGVWWWW